MTNDEKHRPVLLKEVLEYLDPKPGESYLDLTAGYGGHAAAVLERTDKPEAATLVDRDVQAVQELAERFGETDVMIIHQDFLAASEGLVGLGQHFDMILADLGVSSPHLENEQRGFSFKSGPLDMRMDQTQTLTAATIVNFAGEAELAAILRELGEEPKASQIAKKIVGERPIKDNVQLAAIASSVWPGHSKVHPATRTFQALRLSVNNELEQLEQALPLWLELLAPGGRLGVISFHSLEDRLVKQFFNEHAADTYDSPLKKLTKKPIIASREEIAFNPRARSAKLRVSRKK